MIILLLHHFKLERTELDAEGRKEVFPAYRASGTDASSEMDPINDQALECAAQAMPRAAGVRLVPRNPAQLADWLDEGYEALGQFDEAVESS